MSEAHRRLHALLAALLWPCAVAIAAQADFFVAPTGNDAGPGSREEPFATVARARDAVRERVARGLSHNLNVLVRGGTYRLSEPLTFGPEDSGTETHSITYAACPGEKVVVTGNKKEILNDYKERRERGKIRKGPYYPRMPDRLLRRTVRGMIPYQEPRGRTAYRKFMAYVGTPAEFQNQETIVVENALHKGSKSKLTLGDISKNLGAKF